MNPSASDHTIALFPDPAAGFDDPLEMLRACHERILRHCALLCRLAAHLSVSGADTDARTAAVRAWRYFTEAAVNHHRDEEDDLFPLLVRVSEGADLVSLLRAEHAALDAAWQAVRPALEALAAGREAMLDADAVAAMAQAYRAHIEREERDLLPLAARLLDAEQLAHLGQRMATRRGAAFAL